MLSGTTIFFRAAVLAFAGALASGPARAADPPLNPMTVCEVVRNLGSMEGKSFAVLGRYSFRASGTSLEEQSCDPAAAGPAQLRLLENSADGPKPSGSLEINAVELRRKFTELRKRTSLGKFRFGSADYDRWAVVYGRVEPGKGTDGKSAPPTLVFRGDGVVIFLSE